MINLFGFSWNWGGVLLCTRSLCFENSCPGEVALVAGSCLLLWPAGRSSFPTRLRGGLTDSYRGMSSRREDRVSSAWGGISVFPQARTLSFTPFVIRGHN